MIHNITISTTEHERLRTGATNYVLLPSTVDMQRGDEFHIWISRQHDDKLAPLPHDCEALATHVLTGNSAGVEEGWSIVSLQPVAGWWEIGAHSVGLNTADEPLPDEHTHGEGLVSQHADGGGGC